LPTAEDARRLYSEVLSTLRDAEPEERTEFIALHVNRIEAISKQEVRMEIVIPPALPEADGS
jgi:hypothetical protein